tara:strand:+ start:2099 stop:2734 length:636 start_codon:yes stop_codon:yes gene_type:complete
MINTSDPIFIVIFLSLSGIILRTTLVFIGQNWSKTFHYLATFILLPNIAYVVTNVIASNIALSLGMIGALSIVRFRHPVRSNFELTIYFALLTLGIAAGVNIKFAFLLLITIFLTIIGIEFAQKILKKFGINLYQISFNEGITNNVLEISASEKIERIQNNPNLIESYYSQSDHKWEYKLVFKKKSEIDLFLNEISKESKIITYKTSSVIN